MAKSQETYNKKEKEKKRRKKKQEKMEKRAQRKAEREERGKVSFDDLIRYVDENGNLVDTPPDPAKKHIIKAEDIKLGVSPRENSAFKIDRKGRIKFFNEEKGYGFIVDKDTKESIFVHANNISEPLKQDDKVSYKIEMGPKGANAIEVIKL